ncbi:hypothetical protein D7B24_007541 [Verticillium nonalfalfae]|uniref:Thiol methyltransferase 2 n=1 Tax=Verticillium nonalfalfae TaxID=1051616 RepID=A0A3M9Y9P1_9PEZI|nr:uncharacterized protein D7B24_007541 [Verticillium nonalfalfae]RNJ56258.1 hypothetical protein D7B24_007541 [Verticillium nonalfalfae]
MSDHNSNKLSSTFAMSPLASHGPKWSALWEEKYTPWDRGGPSLALNDFLLSRPNLVPPVTSSTAPRPKALVPGCGKGHDVLLLAAFGYDVVGLDFAPAAASEAIENEKSVREALRDGDKTADVYKPKEGVPSVGAVAWATGDFFSNEWLEQSNISEGTTFDLIFDYTFLCALPLSARPKWAARMAALLNPNGGRLVCLEFPSGKPLSQVGPPWGLTNDTYLALLARPGEEPTTAPDGSINVPDIKPGGLRRLELVKPARTHKAGENEDGTVRDWLHVWSLVGA